ncbi:hypothetical protein HOC13_04145 [Candidatus Woesearchaeota archaeon]|jgi:hypothetical protein|nr:hypothetical protein [Candidatus Woesearchaeota archaeon]
MDKLIKTLEELAQVKEEQISREAAEALRPGYMQKFEVRLDKLLGEEVGKELLEFCGEIYQYNWREIAGQYEHEPEFTFGPSVSYKNRAMGYEFQENNDLVYWMFKFHAADKYSQLKIDGNSDKQAFKVAVTNIEKLVSGYRTHLCEEDKEYGILWEEDLEYFGIHVGEWNELFESGKFSEWLDEEIENDDTETD